MNSALNSQLVRSHVLQFKSSLRPEGYWHFPCDAEGRVDMDAMTERMRTNYLFARALVGRDFDPPRIVRSEHPPRRSGCLRASPYTDVAKTRIDSMGPRRDGRTKAAPVLAGADS